MKIYLFKVEDFDHCCEQECISKVEKVFLSKLSAEKYRDNLIIEELKSRYDDIFKYILSNRCAINKESYGIIEEHEVIE